MRGKVKVLNVYQNPNLVQSFLFLWVFVIVFSVVIHLEICAKCYLSLWFLKGFRSIVVILMFLICGFGSFCVLRLGFFFFFYTSWWLLYM